MKNSIKILEDHNAWRRGDDSEQGNPTMIGMAIDDCIQAAKRYEVMRILTPREFEQIFIMNRFTDESFDAMIDELIEERRG